MKYLVAFLCMVATCVSASGFGDSHDIVLFGSVEISAGQTNVIETTVPLTGIAKGSIVYAVGSGVTTTVVASVRGGVARTMATVVANNAAVNSNVTHNLYAETIRFTTINSATNAVTVSPAIIYEK